jgi:hypothetical protein
MDPLMLIPQPKAPASGFWQIASLLHIPIGQGVVLNGEVAQSDNLAKTMAAVVRKAKGSVKEVALSVDAHLVFQIPLGPAAVQQRNDHFASWGIGGPRKISPC